jgi:predicted HAD superfamily Cof-like phosphohydrolase
MKKQLDHVRTFMLAAKQDCPDKQIIPTIDVQNLRLALHEEEAVDELRYSFDNNDREQVLDSILDSLFVVLGTALACGFTAETIEAAFDEVMLSNMSRFIDGYRNPITGKAMKGPSYFPPNLKQFIR